MSPLQHGYVCEVRMHLQCSDEDETTSAAGVIGAKTATSSCPRLLKQARRAGQVLQRCVLQCLLEHHCLFCLPQRAKSLT